MPVIYNKKVEYAYTDPSVKAHTLSWAEYQALSEDDKMNGDLYFIPDKQPEGNPSRIWTKLGTDPLTTQADDVSGAVNELNSSLTNMVKLVTSSNYSVTVPANGAANVTANNLGLVTPLGYSPISCRSYFANSNDLVWRSMDVSAQGTQSFGVIRNVSNVSVTANIIVTIVYVKLSLY